MRVYGVSFETGVLMADRWNKAGVGRADVPCVSEVIRGVDDSA